jgi:pimeloyl-ACP methyl ester carboxylesterase
MPFVHMSPVPLSHVEREWQMRELRRWYERLAEKRMLVRMDPRGFGLSERDVSDHSLDTGVLDLEALVDRLRLERFALLGFQHSGPPAIVYAARHPERVSHLLLWCSYAQPSDWARSPPIQATRALIDKDWETYTETVAHFTL